MFTRFYSAPAKSLASCASPTLSGDIREILRQDSDEFTDGRSCPFPHASNSKLAAGVLVGSEGRWRGLVVIPAPDFAKGDHSFPRRPERLDRLRSGSHIAQILPYCVSLPGLPSARAEAKARLWASPVLAVPRPAIDRPER
nr:hypothetical protein [Methylocapsa sp. RX1]